MTIYNYFMNIYIINLKIDIIIKVDIQNCSLYYSNNTFLNFFSAKCLILIKKSVFWAILFSMKNIANELNVTDTVIGIINNNFNATYRLGNIYWSP